MTETTYDFPMRITLIGGFNCELKCAEANQWQELVWHGGIFRAALEARDGLNCAINRGDEEAAAAHRKKLMDAEEALYELGREWFQGVVVLTRAAEKQAKIDKLARDFTEGTDAT